ncbi:MAG: carboxypeptidase regulatory-like domain-containing protein [Planctomycetaceae bacterium]|nr:carboxypeptidase regulatory-like domain-containing protein [Planctomycetaceae bacterium]
MKNIVCALSFVLLLSGCGGAPVGTKPLPKTVPVTGIVTMNDKPLSSATVTFFPQNTAGGIECYGITDDDGKFKLTQIRGAEGAPPGDYKVTISRFVKKDGTPIKMDGSVAPANVDAVETMPPQYNSPTDTILTVKVAEGGGEIPLKLSGR